MKQRIVQLDLVTIYYGHNPPEDIAQFNADYFQNGVWNSITFATDREHLRKVIEYDALKKPRIEMSEKVRITRKDATWVMTPQLFDDWLNS